LSPALRDPAFDRALELAKPNTSVTSDYCKCQQRTPRLTVNTIIYSNVDDGLAVGKSLQHKSCRVIYRVIDLSERISTYKVDIPPHMLSFYENKRHLPPYIQTITGNLLVGDVFAGRAILKLRQFSDELVTAARKAFPVDNWGQAAPGAVASIVTLLGGIYGWGGANLRSPDVD
jgi:hypothetical protein